VISTVPVQDGPQAPWLDRTVAATVVLAAAGSAWLLARLTPDPRGFDTHTQLGMAPCRWPGAYGVPCPTCGATTAACLLVHGRPLQAVAAQPFGAALAAAGLVAGAVALWCLLRRRSFLDVAAQAPWPRLFVVGSVLLLGSWLYKYLTFTPP
jgi:hypothetical protein